MSSRFQTASHRGPECIAVENFFVDEVWANVGERTCLNCDNADGGKSGSEFLLRATSRNLNSLSKNRVSFLHVAARGKTASHDYS
jgi:hypothetical protein